jgi:hypothetical protein
MTMQNLCFRFGEVAADWGSVRVIVENSLCAGIHRSRSPLFYLPIFES